MARVPQRRKLDGKFPWRGRGTASKVSPLSLGLEARAAGPYSARRPLADPIYGLQLLLFTPLSGRPPSCDTPGVCATLTSFPSHEPVPLLLARSSAGDGRANSSWIGSSPNRPRKVEGEGEGWGGGEGGSQLRAMVLRSPRSEQETSSWREADVEAEFRASEGLRKSHKFQPGVASCFACFSVFCLFVFVFVCS